MPKFCDRPCENRKLSTSQGRNDKKHHVFLALENVRTKWENFVNWHNRTLEWKASRSSKSLLCSEHFDQDFYTVNGRLNESAMPSKAPMFTAELALYWGIVPNPQPHLLDIINDFEKCTKEVHELIVKEVELTAALKTNKDLGDSTKGALVSDLPNPHSTSCLMEAEFVQMPVVSDLPVMPGQASSLCPTEIIYSVDSDVENNPKSNETQHQPCQPSSFDILEVNARSDIEITPVKRGRKHYAGDLTESDFISPCRRKESVTIFKNTLKDCKRKVKTLQQTLQRNQNRINYLESLLKDLLCKKLIVPDGLSIIKASRASLCLQDSV